MPRARGTAGLDVAAGECAYTLRDFTDLLDGPAVHCLPADVTRCGGITALPEVAGPAAARHTGLSAHRSPALSAHAFCAVRRLRHLEYFNDHVRVGHPLLDGTPTPVGGALRPDPGRPGLGPEVRWAAHTVGSAGTHTGHGPSSSGPAAHSPE